jgi:hypothetical protein
LSFGGVKKLNWLFAPRLPYLTATDNLFKKGSGPLVEVPLSALFFPYVGTTMRVFPWLTAIQRHGIHLEAAYINGKPVVFDIHPNEFIDESEEPRIIHNRSSNKLAYFIQDYLRAQLKTKNLGPKAIHLYEKEVQFYLKRGYQFTTVQEYCRQTGFIK